MLSLTRRECKPALVQPRACSRTAKSSRNGEILIYISSAPGPEHLLGAYLYHAAHLLFLAAR